MKKTFDKIVKGMKDVQFRATIHLNDKNIISIGLGRNYFEKKNPHGKGTLEDEVIKRLIQANIMKNSWDYTKGIEILASSSDFNDKQYTKAQYDIRGGV